MFRYPAGQNGIPQSFYRDIPGTVLVWEHVAHKTHLDNGYVYVVYNTLADRYHAGVKPNGDGTFTIYTFHSNPDPDKQMRPHATRVADMDEATDCTLVILRMEGQI